MTATAQHTLNRIEALAYVAMGGALGRIELEPLERVETLAEIQRLTGDALATAVGRAHDTGATWKALAAATGMNHTTLWRQWQGGGPVVVMRATHGTALPEGSIRLPDGWVQDSLFDVLETT